MFQPPALKSAIGEPRLFGLLLLSLCFSGFDATATLQHVRGGIAVELNPFMNYFLELGDITFFLVKVLLTSAGLWVCYVMREHKLARWGIWLTAGIYQAVTIYHLFIYSTAYPAN